MRRTRARARLLSARLREAVDASEASAPSCRATHVLRTTRAIHQDANQHTRATQPCIHRHGLCPVPYVCLL